MEEESKKKKSNNSYISNKNGKSIFSRHIGGYDRSIHIDNPISSQSSDETEEIRQFIQRAGEREIGKRETQKIPDLLINLEP